MSVSSAGRTTGSSWSSSTVAEGKGQVSPGNRGITRFGPVSDSPTYPSPPSTLTTRHREEVNRYLLSKERYGHVSFTGCTKISHLPKEDTRTWY